MKITVQKNDLVSAVSAVEAAASRSSTLMILRQIRLGTCATAQRLQLEALNLDTYARATCPATVDETGFFCLDASGFASAAAQLTTGAASIEPGKRKCTLSTPDGPRYELPVMAPDDWPDWADHETEIELRIDGSALAKALSTCFAAVPKKDPRRVLLGVLFHWDGTRMLVVSTDGKKLVRYVVAAEAVGGVSGATPQAIVPTAAAQQFAAVADGIEDLTLRFGSEGRRVSLEADSVLVDTCTIEGDFPKYEMVIPREFVFSAQFSRDELVANLRRAAVVTGEDNNVTLSWSKSDIHVHAQCHDTGIFDGHQSCKRNLGTTAEVVFNASYLRDILRAVDYESLQFLGNRKNEGPCLFLPSGKNITEDVTLLLMPVKQETPQENPSKDEDEADTDIETEDEWESEEGGGYDDD